MGVRPSMILHPFLEFVLDKSVWVCYNNSRGKQMLPPTGFADYSTKLSERPSPNWFYMGFTRLRLRTSVYTHSEHNLCQQTAHFFVAV